MASNASLKSGWATFARWLAEQYHLKLVFGGNPQTNGKTIWLPQLPIKLTKDDETLVKGDLYHEVGHCKFTNFDFYVGFCKKHGRFAGSLLNAVEDVWEEGVFSRKSKRAERFLRESAVVLEEKGNAKTGENSISEAYITYVLSRGFVQRNWLEYKDSLECAKTHFLAHCGEDNQTTAEDILNQTDKVLLNLHSSNSTQDNGQIVLKLLDVLRKAAEGETSDSSNPKGDGGDEGDFTDPGSAEGEASDSSNPQGDGGEEGDSTDPGNAEGEASDSSDPKGDGGEEGDSTDLGNAEGETSDSPDSKSDGGDEGSSTDPGNAEGEASASSDPQGDGGEEGDSTDPGNSEGEASASSDPKGDGGVEGDSTDSGNADGELTDSIDPTGKKSVTEFTNQLKEMLGGPGVSGEIRDRLKALVELAESVANGERPEYQGLALVPEGEVSDALQGSKAGEGITTGMGVAEDDHDSYRQLKSELGKKSAVLASKLKVLLRTKEQQRTDIGKRGKLATKKLYRIPARDPRLFKKTERISSNRPAVSVLADLSYSTQAYGIAPFIQKTLLMMADALDIIQAPYELIGFGGRTELLTLVKGFSDGATQTKARIGGMSQSVGGGTPMAQAVWETSQRMYPHKDRSRYMFVLTDGEPNCIDATVQYTKQAEEDGVKTIYFLLGEQVADEWLAENNLDYVHVPAIDDLHSTVLGSLKQVLI